MTARGYRSYCFDRWRIGDAQISSNGFLAKAQLEKNESALRRHSRSKRARQNKCHASASVQRTVFGRLGNITVAQGSERGDYAGQKCDVPQQGCARRKRLSSVAHGATRRNRGVTDRALPGHNYRPIGLAAVAPCLERNAL
ncbi:MAG: hypothetical protein AAFZ01_11220, partial [Pseudomonadota bacterium]